MIKKTILFFILGYGILLHPAYAAKVINTEIDGEKIGFKTDGRQWTAGFEHDDGKNGIIEYVLPGEKIDSWSELVTINYFRGITDADALPRFMSFTENGLRNQCRKIQWAVISKKEKAINYEWTARECGGGWVDQSEVARVIQGKKGMYVLHYASKKVPISQEKRAVWANLLSKAVVTV